MAPSVSTEHSLIHDGHSYVTPLRASVQIDAGSSSPSGAVTRRSLSPSGPFELGKHTVQLTISNTLQSDSCSATVIVQVCLVLLLMPPIMLREAYNIKCHNLMAVRRLSDASG